MVITSKPANGRRSVGQGFLLLRRTSGKCVFDPLPLHGMNPQKRFLAFNFRGKSIASLFSRARSRTVTSLTLRPRHCNRHLIWTARPLRRLSPTHIPAGDSTARERDGVLLLLLGS